MSKRPITVRRVKNAMEKAVAEKGREYVYDSNNGCDYVRYDEAATASPSCLVGHALYYLGIPLSRLHEVEGNVPTTGYMVDLLDEYGVPVEVRGPLTEAQSRQDGGAAWGVALDTFYEALDHELKASA